MWFSAPYYSMVSMHSITQAVFSTLLQHCINASTLIVSCAVLQRNPVLRPSAAEALEHPWLAVEGEANEMPLQVGLCDNKT
jgi:hypothetical protein